MQIIGVVGKLNNKKFTANTNGQGKNNAKVTFSVGVRKAFVTDQDKQNNKVNYFIPCIAWGTTAEFINQYFNNGDGIACAEMEYQTFRTKNADPNNNYDDGHIFNVKRANFVGDKSGGGNTGNNNQNQNQGGYQNNGGGGYNQNQGGGYGGNQQPVGAGAGNQGGGYQPSDDLPF